MRPEHSPHIGDKYREGIAGKRVAVVGFSHYVSDATDDSEDFTRECVRKLLEGEWATDPIFFRLVAKAFGSQDPRDFFRRIMFFNWAPFSMGGDEEKFDNITRPEQERAALRFKRLLIEHEPDLVFIFTTKAKLTALGTDFAPLAEPLGHFSRGGLGRTQVYRLRHTQGVTAAELSAAISWALKAELPSA